MDLLDPRSLIATIQALVAAWGLKLLAAIGIFFLGRIMAGWVRRVAASGFQRARLDPSLTPFLANLVFAGVLTFVVLAALQVLGVPTGSAIAVLGAAGLAIALAFQGTLSNFAAGVMLLTFRPFRLGDFVEAAGVAGTVEEVGVFMSTLSTPDNVRIVMPNSKISDEVIKNYTANATRRVDLVMGVGYDDDLDLALATIRGVLTAEARVLEDPEPVVAVDALGASSVDIVVRPWVATADYWGARRDLVKALKEGLEAAGLTIPYPQRDVHLFHENAPPGENASPPGASDRSEAG